MQWRLFATLAEAAGDTTVNVDVGEDPTVGDALDALLTTAPELEEHVLTQEGEVYDHVRLLHEGSDPFVEAEGLATSIEEGDELALFPPMSGG